MSRLARLEVDAHRHGIAAELAAARRLYAGGWRGRVEADPCTGSGGVLRARLSHTDGRALAEPCLDEVMGDRWAAERFDEDARALLGLEDHLCLEDTLSCLVNLTSAAPSPAGVP